MLVSQNCVCSSINFISKYIFVMFEYKLYFVEIQYIIWYIKYVSITIRMKKWYDYSILQSYFRSHITETALNDFHLHKHGLEHIDNSTGEMRYSFLQWKYFAGGLYYLN